MFEQFQHDPTPTVYAAIELSKKTWVVAILAPGKVQPSLHRFAGGSLAELVMKLRAASAGKRVLICYEAGYDGFWLARALASEGLECRVLDPASFRSTAERGASRRTVSTC
jgi:transposase